MTEPFGKRRLKAVKEPYDAEAFVNRIKSLLEQRNETGREAALKASLDHQTIYRVFTGQRPSMVTCILLANHFEVNPNEFLELASWPTLKVFEIETKSAEHLPPEAVDVALDIAKIPDSGTRKQVAEAIRILLRQYILD